MHLMHLMRLGLSFTGPVAIGGAASLVQRFLMALAKLWRLPPRGGFARMLGPNCSKFIQACVSPGLEETLSRRSASTELQDTLAAFGMCLIVPSGEHGCDNGAVVKPGATAVTIGACAFVASAFEIIIIIIKQVFLTRQLNAILKGVCTVQRLGTQCSTRQKSADQIYYIVHDLYQAITQI